jgi:hypothetical protein
VIANCTVNIDAFGNFSSCNCLAIDFFHHFYSFWLITREIVLASESFIRKGQSSSSTVYKGMGVTCNITFQKGAQYDQVRIIQFIFLTN